MDVSGLELDNLGGLFMSLPKIVEELKKRIFDTDSGIIIEDTNATNLSGFEIEENPDEENK